MAECLQQQLSDGKCSYWDEDNPEENTCLPEGCDSEGNCVVGGDPYPGDNCSNFQAQWGDEYCGRSGELKTECDCEDCADVEEVCDYCGEPLGFCAPDCETRDPDFEED